MGLIGPLLEAFAAVVARKTVLHAATDLGITQTAVTQRIRGLESMLGSTLFLRSRKGMMLTSEGEALVRYYETVRGLEGELMSQLKGPGLERTTWLTITGPSTTIRCRVIPAAAQVLEKFPHLRLNVRVSDGANLLEDIRRGTAHFAIVPRNQVPLEMDSKLLKRERYILVGRRIKKNLPFKEILASAVIVDFDEQDRMTLGFLEKYRLLAHSVRERHYVNNTDALADLVVHGNAMTVLSEEFAQPYLDDKLLVNLCPQYFYDHEIALVWYPRGEMPGYFAEVIRGVG